MTSRRSRTNKPTFKSFSTNAPMIRNWDFYTRKGLDLASATTELGFAAVKTGTKLGVRPRNLHSSLIELSTFLSSQLRGVCESLGSVGVGLSVCRMAWWIAAELERKARAWKNSMCMEERGHIYSVEHHGCPETRESEDNFFCQPQAQLLACKSMQVASSHTIDCGLPLPASFSRSSQG